MTATFACLLSLFHLAAAPVPPVDFFHDTSAGTVAGAVVWLGGLAVVCVVGNQVMGAWINFRKIKGTDPMAEARYALKEEHNNLARKVSSVEGKVDNLTLSLQSELRDINRSLGRLEGALGTAKNEER